MGSIPKISQTEWFIILLLIGFVFAAELINSSIENICDLVSPEKNDYVKKAKYQGAAAIFIAAFISAIIGCLIFIPKIIALLK